MATCKACRWSGDPKGSTYCPSCGLALGTDGEPGEPTEAESPENQGSSFQFNIQNDGFPDSLSEIGNHVVQGMIMFSCTTMNLKISRLVLERTSSREFSVGIAFEEKVPKDTEGAIRNLASTVLIVFEHENSTIAPGIDFRVIGLSAQSGGMMANSQEKSQQAVVAALRRWNPGAEVASSTHQGLIGVMMKYCEASMLVAADGLREKRTKAMDMLKEQRDKAKAGTEKALASLSEFTGELSQMGKGSDAKEHIARLVQVSVEEMKDSFASLRSNEVMLIAFDHCLNYVQSGGDLTKLGDVLELATKRATEEVQASTAIGDETANPSDRIAAVARSLGSGNEVDALNALLLLSSKYHEETRSCIPKLVELIPADTVDPQAALLLRVLSRVSDPPAPELTEALPRLIRLMGLKDELGWDGAFDVISSLSAVNPLEVIPALPKLARLLEGDEWRRGTDFAHLNVRNASAFLVDLQNKQPQDILPFVPRVVEMLYDIDQTTALNAALLMWNLAEKYPAVAMEYLPMALEVTCRSRRFAQAWNHGVVSVINDNFPGKRESLLSLLSEVSAHGDEDERKNAEEIAAAIRGSSSG